MMDIGLLSISLSIFFMVHLVYLILAYFLRDETVNYIFKQALSDGIYVALIAVFLLFIHEALLTQDSVLASYLSQMAAGMGASSLSVVSIKDYTLTAARTLVNINYALLKGYSWGIGQIDILSSIYSSLCRDFLCVGGAGSMSISKRLNNYVNYVRSIGFPDIKAIITGGIMLTLLNFAFDPRVELLVYFAVFIRAFPGMKYLSNVLLGIFTAYAVTFPILLYVEFTSIHGLISHYFQNTEEVVLQKAFPHFISEIKAETPLLNPNFFSVLFGGLNYAKLNVLQQDDAICIAFNNKIWTCDKLFREVYFVVFMMSYFMYPLTFVGMAIGAKAISALLGEYDNFIEMFIRAWGII